MSKPTEPQLHLAYANDDSDRCASLTRVYEPDLGIKLRRTPGEPMPPVTLTTSVKKNKTV